MELHKRIIRLIREYEVTSEDSLINLEIQETFGTESGGQFDTRLINSRIEILDPAKEEVQP